MKKGNWNQLSNEAKDSIYMMIEYCVERGIRLGMDEGMRKDGKPKKFRKEIEEFAGITAQETP
ncbi:MAG: hypothetical protein BWK73_10475 [Thiothrix lacustris]|uniref:Uncharacterized protein n=1 Tax=Thiothrix lacustris TaxID=525917 RepID=A0A1Y1QUE6_9GAMM|nr:MAG: hypothetical protein BWK73_10475 [Thiothrix lacustris]